MKKLAVITALLCVAAGAPARRADEVRAAETAFAKAFADRDSNKFFSFVADDAHFLGPRRTLNGRNEVKEGWANFFKDAKAPFRWEPERVAVNDKGDIGLSTGPIYDPDGKHVGNYSSVWQRQKNGTWKVIFDGPGSPVCEEPKK